MCMNALQTSSLIQWLASSPAEIWRTSSSVVLKPTQQSTPSSSGQACSSCFVLTPTLFLQHNLGYWSCVFCCDMCTAAHTVLPLSADSSRQGTQHSSAQSCLCCAGTQVPSSQQGPDISSLKPNLQKEWDHAKNSHLGSIVVTPGSHRKAWWKCDKCPHGKPHEWEAQVNGRSAGRDCPFCSSVAVCSHNSLATLTPHIAKEWDYAANELTPDNYTWKSNALASWECHICSHHWAWALTAVYYRILDALNAMRQGVVTRKTAQEPAIQPWLQQATL